MGDLVTSLKVMNQDGTVKILKKNEIEFGYRFSNLDGYIILEARLKLDNADSHTLVASMSQFLKMKKGKQALDMPSAGCVFKNPPNFNLHAADDRHARPEGHRIGSAEVSGHANFIINRAALHVRMLLRWQILSKAK
jgi:UDP-N-acetylmuramate dehydrogenase